MFIDYRFNDKFQAIARIHRFMQKHEVTLYLVYAESEQEIYKTFMEKWKRHNEMVQKMSDLLRTNGLYGTDTLARLSRYMFSQREEESGKLWRAINNDNCLELPNMEENSVGLIVTSIPFSNQYEYTSAYNDYGFNEDNAKFFEQMDFLTPHLLRVLQPGRMLCCHVKDRVLSGYKGGTCFQTVVPFSDLSVLHYIKHGFKYCGRITIDTDVVQENNKSYRLGYTEMCKDGTKMSVGCPEYILLFRKEPSDKSDAYADVPVVKSKDEYSLARWQIDAHGDWKSSGERLLTYEDVRGLSLEGIREYYRNFAKDHIYNYEDHVAFSETLGAAGRLSKESFVLAPVSHSPYIWDLGDYQRAKTLNSRQARADRQVHICPLPLDLVTRCIERWSNKGDVVFDPFGGIQTVPYCAIKMGRKGLSTELNYDYWRDGLTYLREAEQEMTSPTLFDFMDFNNGD
jgi:DNA modification methylase